MTALMTSAGIKTPAEVSGIFIDGCIAPSVAALRVSCAGIPEGAPAGATKPNCILIPAGDEDTAAAIAAKPTRSAADSQQAVQFTSTIVHEFQHAHFNDNASTIVTAQPECNLDTVLFTAKSGTEFKVKKYLSEMAAEIAEFAPFFEATKSSPGKASNGAMFDEERRVTTQSGENIKCILKALQCHCECGTVNKFSVAVFDDTTSSWPADQKLEFQKAMTRIMRSFWPVPLQKK